MNLSTILGVLGIVVTILFGIWGVYIFIHRRYPGQVTLVVDDCIGLFDTIVKNFPELAVLYQDQPVSHGLVLFKGTFLNSGTKDITPEMVENKITLSLPSGFSWLAAKTITSSPNVQASVKAETNSLSLSTGLFRCQEYLKFEALAEMPLPEKDKSIEEKLIDEIRPTHRIAETGKIQKVVLPPESYTKRRFRKRIIPTFFMAVGGIILFVLYIFMGFPAKLNFEVPQKDGRFAEVRVEPMIDGRVHIKNKNYNIDEKVQAETFFSRSEIRPKIVTDPHAKYIIPLALIAYVIAPIVLMCIAVSEQRKWKHLRKQIGSE